MGKVILGVALGVGGIFVLLVVVVIFFAAAPGEDGESFLDELENSLIADGPATLAEFSRIQTGMTYAQVVEIIGAEGEVMSESSFADGLGGQITSSIYTWEGSGEFGANMNATFSNGELMAKAQFNLK